MDNHKERAFYAVVGALVGDAASMGLHWLYDQERILHVAGFEPEFRSPNRFDYQDKGYFAHQGKTSGEQSQYGAQLLAMVDSLVNNQKYDEANYIQHFRFWFDFGGSWQGYIDKATRMSLLNIHQLELEDAPITACGADDTQLPAVSKIIPLVACTYTSHTLPAMVESAVRVTNNNDKAVEWAQAITLLVQAAIQGNSPLQSVEMVRQTCSKFVHDQIDMALADPELSITDAAKKFGLHCELSAAFPLLIRIIAGAQSYKQGIRDNILCGGDSCGRAIVIGAVLAACFYEEDAGIPTEWLKQVELNGGVLSLPIE